jgi:bacteriocin-like protein
MYELDEQELEHVTGGDSVGFGAAGGSATTAGATF